MNEHIHIDGDHVVIYEHRLTLDEAHSALSALRDAVALADSLARRTEEADRLARARADLLARGWEESADPAVLVRLKPGYSIDADSIGAPVAADSLRHRPVHVAALLDPVAHVSTGAPYCVCGANIRGATVLHADHGLPMCRAHRGQP